MYLNKSGFANTDLEANINVTEVSPAFYNSTFHISLSAFLTTIFLSIAVDFLLKTCPR